MQIYDDCFPKAKFKIKSNNKANPWITKGMAKSSKRKQKLYEKFLKNRSIQNEKIYNNYGKLFETITMKSKWRYYSEKLLKFQAAAKNTWQIMKEVIGKSKVIQPNLLRKIVIIFEEERIANAFNNFYVNIGLKLADDIQTATRSRSSRLEMFCKKVFLRCSTLLRSFPLNCAKFLNTPFITQHLRWLLLKIFRKLRPKN